MNRTCPIGSVFDRYPMKSDMLLLLFLALILLFVLFFLSGHCVQFVIVAVFFLLLFNNKDTEIFNHERMLSFALRVQPSLSASKFYSITHTEHEQSSPCPGSSPIETRRISLDRMTTIISRVRLTSSLTPEQRRKHRSMGLTSIDDCKRYSMSPLVV